MKWRLLKLNFKIPTKLELGGRTITVKYVDKCYEAETDVQGQAIYKKDTIELKNEDKNDVHSKDYAEWIFWHELVHFIFYSMFEEELRQNENIISRFATFLQQAIKTME